MLSDDRASELGSVQEDAITKEEDEAILAFDITPPPPQRVDEVPTWAVLLFFFCSVWLWRSVWNLTDYYLLPDETQWSNWLTLLVGVAGITFLRVWFRGIHLSKWLQ